MKFNELEYVKGYLPNVKVIHRDKAHAARRITSRGWVADRYLQEVAPADSLTRACRQSDPSLLEIKSHSGQCQRDPVGLAQRSFALCDVGGGTQFDFALQLPPAGQQHHHWQGVLHPEVAVQPGVADGFQRSREERSGYRLELSGVSDHKSSHLQAISSSECQRSVVRDLKAIGVLSASAVPFRHPNLQ